VKEQPKLAEALTKARFELREEVGRWIATRTVGGREVLIPVDLLVPAAVAGAGRRAARLEGQEKNVARRVVGLEAVLVDNDILEISSLDGADTRRIRVAVAGPAALLIAKAHKIAERSGDIDRSRQGRA
jgi:hypothetical protein